MARVERVLAPNPGPFTGPGTNSYVIGAGGEALILDPGPLLPEHIAAIRRAVGELTPVGVVVTHTHLDHAPAANPIGAELEVPVYGFAPGDGFSPTDQLCDGDSIPIGSAALVAVHTPGHTADHVCFQLGDALFTGDHIMGGSTVVIEDAAAYMASLEKVAALDPSLLYPGHGPELRDAGRVIAEYIAHRSSRERQIMDAVRSGAATIGAVVDSVYQGLAPSLRAAAVFQAHTQLIKLSSEGWVVLGRGGAHENTTIQLVESP